MTSNPEASRGPHQLQPYRLVNVRSAGSMTAEEAASRASTHATFGFDVGNEFPEPLTDDANVIVPSGSELA